MSNSERSVGDHCVEAYQQFLDNSVRFKATELYLVKLEIGSKSGNVALKEAHDQFAKVLNPQYGTPAEYFLANSFILLVASFEILLQEILAAIITVNPKKIGQIEFKLSEIVDSEGPDELIRRGVEATLNKLMYRKPLEYLADMSNLLSISEEPLKKSWPVFVEAKARRDLGVHNAWKCNAIYLRKVAEAGLKPAFQDGESVFPKDRKYFDGVREALFELASLIIDAVIVKHPASLIKPKK